ncbi:MAG: EamA family transporter [Desulfuromonadales bacterium]|nr:EamA family transporter [Desulfuromonadales bacterium]
MPARERVLRANSSDGTAASISPLAITTGAVFWAAIMTTPLMVVEWRFLPVRGLDNSLLWGAVLYLGVVATAGAFYLWNKGLSLVEAGTASVFFFLQPVVGENRAINTTAAPSP